MGPVRVVEPFEELAQGGTIVGGVHHAREDAHNAVVTGHEDGNLIGHLGELRQDHGEEPLFFPGKMGEKIVLQQPQGVRHLRGAVVARAESVHGFADGRDQRPKVGVIVLEGRDGIGGGAGHGPSFYRVSIPKAMDRRRPGPPAPRQASRRVLGLVAALAGGVLVLAALGSAGACGGNVAEMLGGAQDAGPQGCGPGQTVCGDACASLVELDNCGACGATCRPSAGKYVTCVDVEGVGTCVACSPGEVPCGRSCARVRSSRQDCGECGHRCGETECQDFACRPRDLAWGLFNPNRIAVGPTTVHWTDLGNVQLADTLGTQPLLGEACSSRDNCSVSLEAVDAGGASSFFPSAIAARGPDVFVATRKGILRYQAQVPGPPTLSYAGPGVQGNDLYVDDRHLCWGVGTGDAVFLCTDLAGDNTQEIISGTNLRAGPFAVAGGVFYGVVQDGSAPRFRVVQSALGSACNADRCPLILDNGPQPILSVAVADGWLYLRAQIAEGHHTIFRKSLGAPCTQGPGCLEVVAEDILGREGASANRILTDGRFVYWHTATTVNRQRIGEACHGEECNEPAATASSNATNPGSPRVLTGGFSTILDIAQDDSFLYVTGLQNRRPSEGVVVRVSK